MAGAGRFATLGRVGRWLLRYAPRFMVYNRWNVWGKQRELPVAPRESFRELYRKRERASAVKDGDTQ